jgi:Flp pilus assembly protein TadG
MGSGRVIRKLFHRTEGSVAAITAVCLVVFLALVSLAIDMGHLYTVRNSLQNSADAAALAGAGNLIHDYGSGVVRDATTATQKAMEVAQRQSQLSGLPTVADGARNDLTITFGVWNVNAGNPATAWTEIGPTCSSDSSANAVKVTLRRSGDTVYGPVTNFFAGIMGYDTSQVAATATAYLGYTTSTYAGTVAVPLALPLTMVTAMQQHHSGGWFAWLFGPRQAVASTPQTYTFKDTGGGYVNTTVTSANPLDPNHAYLFTVGKYDSVPYTIWNILEKIYNPNKTGDIVNVGALKLGQQIYARSEFKYGSAYITPIFKRLKYAYNYKTTGNAYTSPDPGTPWRVTLPVYGTTPTPVASHPVRQGFMALGRLLSPLWPTPAYACYTMPPPETYVNGFVNVDITDVTYSDSCLDCNYRYFPTYIGGVRYTSKLDCMQRHPDSCWNDNTVTVENVTEGETSPTSEEGGGNDGGLTGGGSPTGAFASIPRLVK